MGFAAIEDAFTAISSGSPVVVAGGELPAPGIVAVPAPLAPAMVALLAGRVSSLRSAPPGDSLGTVRRAGIGEVLADLARLSGYSGGLGYAIVHAVAGPAPDHAVLARLADDLAAPLVSADDLVHHRWRHERLVERVASSTVPTEYAVFTGHAYRSRADGEEHLALTLGDVVGGDPVLVRVHSECLTGDVFGSRRCDCGAQLAVAGAAIGAAGRGVLIYLRGHEGRGIGLADKLRAYALQDAGLDTVDANLALGHAADARRYTTAAQILSDLGVTAVRLMTNNPAKCAALADLDIAVEERVPLVIPPTPDNRRYLEAKRFRLGHLLDEST